MSVYYYVSPAAACHHVLWASIYLRTGIGKEGEEEEERLPGLRTRAHFYDDPFIP